MSFRLMTLPYGTLIPVLRSADFCAGGVSRVSSAMKAPGGGGGCSLVGWIYQRKMVGQYVVFSFTWSSHCVLAEGCTVVAAAFLTLCYTLFLLEIQIPLE